MFGCFVEIKRHAMTKRAAILFELPGSCDYWKDERLHEVIHDGTSHDFDGCRYGLKQRYAKKPLPIKKPWRVVSWNFDLGNSLSKKCNGNHEHGPCAGRETKETQLYTSLIVSVILRRFLARAKCLQQARLKPALACIVWGNPRRRQTAACESHITSTAPKRFRARPGPQVPAGCISDPFRYHIYCCLFWVFLVLENIINASVVNTNEFFCVPVGKSRQAAIFLGNLVKNVVDEGEQIPRRMEMSSDLGTCVKWVEDIGVPVIYAYSAYYSAKCRGMMKGEGQSMRVALEFLSKIFGLLSADECMLGWRERILQQGDKSRSSGCWNGVMNLSGTNEDQLRRELDWIFRQNERAAWNSVEFSRNESDKHLARNAARHASSYASPAARKGEKWGSSDWQSWSNNEWSTWAAAAAVADSLPGGGVKNASVADLHVQHVTPTVFPLLCFCLGPL